MFEKYTAFKKEFDSNEEPSLGYITLQRDWVLPKTTDSEFLSKYKNENEYNIGIDLPILLEPQIPNGKSIMFIAEDPLRDNIPKICQDVVLSTPFGVHIKSCREKKLKVYWRVFDELLKRGYRIYVTDTYKVWIKQFTKTGRNAKEKVEKVDDLYQTFVTSLQKEIEWINPSKIVCYGNVALNSISNLKLQSNVIQITHPAARNKVWINNLLTLNEGDLKATHENKIRYILSMINSK